MAVKRLSKIAKELNVGISSLVDHLKDKGIEIESSPNTKVEEDVYNILLGEFVEAKIEKEKSEEVSAIREKKPALEPIKSETIIASAGKLSGPAILGKIDLSPKKKEPAPVKEESIAEEIKPVVEEVKPAEKIVVKEIETIKAKFDKLTGPSVVGKIDVSAKNKKEQVKEETKSKPTLPKDETPKKEETVPVIDPNPAKKEEVKDEIKTIKAVSERLTGPKILGKIVLPVDKVKERKKAAEEEKKKKRKRIKKVNVEKAAAQKNIPDGRRTNSSNISGGNNRPGVRRAPKVDATPEEIQREIKETLARLSGGGKKKGDKYRRSKRDAKAQEREDELEREEEQSTVLKLTEFVTVSDLASLMNVTPTDVISACMSLGIFASINQRIDAETIAIIADEFNYSVEFISAEDQIGVVDEEIEDKEEDLLPRAPIVTVMGHVDHGKTSLLDYIRNAKIAEGEAGGITQHIGAYKVTGNDTGRQVTFLDTPGHEAFTAMRARGAAVTDIAIIIIAADDNIMPQTKEAINHAQAAGVPIVFAINKIDKDGANPDNVKTQLAAMNLLIEEWGGKYQSQDISAKKGTGVEDLIEKVLLEAELLDLKANPNRNASGTILESSLDKGRGYVNNILVEKGTLKVGDMLLAGHYYGKVKAMNNEKGEKVLEVGPATPVSILGLNGAPNAGDKFNVLKDEREAKQIATKREQLQREQGVRTKKHITLDEIGRRLAIGDFKELNVIVKGDVDGSIEALSDSLLKLSTEEIAVNVIHKAVGAISESDVMLASASDAVIIGFQVRPTAQARRLAENEEIDIRLYSVIYKAIEEIKEAMEGMLSPDIVEEIVGTAEIRETFKITKVGTIAGCYVLEGKLNRNSDIRIIRDGIVVYSGKLGSLKRFKDDVKEVKFGYECGLNIDKFNDIKEGDIVEAYEEKEVAKKLK
jgi:translation initiation factor IF-2